MSATTHVNLHLPQEAETFPSDWVWHRLEELCIGVFDCHHSTPKLTLEGPFVVRSQDILGGVLDFTNIGHVSEETYIERTSRAEPQEGDILYSREGTYFGIAAEVPRDTRLCLGQRMVLIRPDNQKLHSRFLRYWLNSPIVSRHLHGFRDGSVAERLNMSTIRALPVPLPTLEEQREIARILGALDDKIELNRRMNETLEATARAIFKSWFVDFDPVRTKAEGRQPVGMDAETAALFPDDFEESELGAIPRGWRIATLSDTATFTKGVSYKSDELQDSSVALVTLKSVMRGGGYSHNGLKAYTGRFKPSQVLVSGEVVVAHTDVTQAADVLGRAARVQETPLFEILVASLDLVIVRPNDVLTNEYLYLLLSRPEFTEHALGYSNGTTVLHLNSQALPNFKFVFPPASLVGKFTRFVQAIFARLDISERESRILAEARNTLLSKLISGEVRVGS